MGDLQWKFIEEYLLRIDSKIDALSVKIDNLNKAKIKQKDIHLNEMKQELIKTIKGF